MTDHLLRAIPQVGLGLALMGLAAVLPPGATDAPASMAGLGYAHAAGASAQGPDSAAGVWRCTEPNGRTRYQQQPCVDGGQRLAQPAMVPKEAVRQRREVSQREARLARALQKEREQLAAKPGSPAARLDGAAANAERPRAPQRAKQGQVARGDTFHTKVPRQATGAQAQPATAGPSGP